MTTAADTERISMAAGNFIVSLLPGLRLLIGLVSKPSNCAVLKSSSSRETYLKETERCGERKSKRK